MSAGTGLEHMDLKSFRKEILIATLCAAVLGQIVSLPLHGPDLWFTAGLAAGTLTTIICFLILTRTGTLVEVTKKGGPVVTGYFIRMLLYGLAFLVCIKLSVPCGFGCLAGFVTLHFGILVLYGIVYRFILKKKNPLNDWTEPKEWNDLSVYDDEDDDW